MKLRALLFIVTTTLLFNSISYASVKTGAVCSKLGATAIVSGKKYTCIKSGKKLIWDKGALLPKIIPTVSVPAVETKPLPEPSPTTTTVNLENSTCLAQGDQKTDSFGILECRPIKDNNLVLMRITQSFPPLTNSTSPDSLKTCQIGDQRTTKTVNSAIAYPPRPARGFINNGVEKIVVVGIDFIDSPGAGSPTTLFEKDLKTAGEWIKWFSNGKLQYNFISFDKWIRAPKSSGNYEVTEHGSSLSGLTNDEIKSDLISSIEKTVDLSNTAAIWVYYPESIEKITGKFAERGALVKSQKYGDIFSDMYAVGKMNYDTKMPNWTYFVHETMHSQGIMGHSPREPWVFGLMLNDSSPSHTLNTWDQITFDWLLPEQVYCVDFSNLKTTRLTLVPAEREQNGLRSAMIRLNEHKVLVIESHREDKWSYALGAGFYGVMTYVVDTSIDASFDGEIANGKYLSIPGARHGQHKPQGTPISGYPNTGFGLVNGIGVGGDQSRWDLNFMMYLGESLTYEGIKISLVASGDNDTIEISKA